MVVFATSGKTNRDSSCFMCTVNEPPGGLGHMKGNIRTFDIIIRIEISK
jgi:hypothetical protein